MDQGADGDAVAAGGFGEVGDLVHVREGALVVGDRGDVRVEGGGFHSGQGLRPSGAGGFAVTAENGFEVVAEGCGGGWQRSSVVNGDDVGEDQGVRPAIGQDVVHGLDQPVLSGAQRHQGVAQRGRVCEVERLGEFLAGNGSYVRTVGEAPGKVHVVRNDLDDPAVAGFPEAGAQGVVPAHRGLNRSPQPRRIDLPDQLSDLLDGIRVHFGGHRVEVHALLQRQQRQHVGRVSEGVDVVLGELDQGKVRGGTTGNVGRYQLAQHSRPVAGQRHHPVLAQQPGRPGQRGFERVTGGEGVDFQGHRRVRRVHAFAQRRRLTPVRLVRRSTKAAQVVEQDLRCRAEVVILQPAQRAVTQPLRGNRAELLLHRPSGGLEVHGRAGFEAYGVDRGEPADRAGQVKIAGAPMAFEADQHRLLRPAPPAVDRNGQPGEQHVVDATVHRRGHAGQQRYGHLGRQRHRNRADRRSRVDGRVGGPVTEQRTRLGQRGAPEVLLATERHRSCCERTERGSHLRKRQLASEILGENAPRDAVDHQVVDDQQQLATVPRGAQHDAVRRVQARDLGLLVDRPLGDQPGRPQAGGGHVQGAVERGAQQVMAVEQRLQLLHQAGTGQRGRGVPGHRLVEVAQRCRGLHRLGEHRGEPDVAQTVVNHGLDGGRRQRGGEGLNAAAAEHVTGSHGQTGLAGAPGHGDGRDAVAADGEEVVVDADLLQTEDAGVDAGQGTFTLIAGIADNTEDRGGLGQRLGVELAVDRERQGLHGGVERRDHVRRQPLGQRRADVGREGFADQVRVELAVTGDHRGLPDTGYGRHGAFHLTQLDAVTADLDLVIAAPEEVEVAVGALADQVTGAVQATAVRPGDEARRGQGRAVQIAAGQAGPGDVQLTDDTTRHRAQPVVQHVADGVENRSADGGGGAVRRTRAQGVDRVFGGSVEVVTGRAAGVAEPRPDRVGDGLAAEQHQPHAMPVEQTLVEQVMRVRRGHVDHVDAVGVAVGHQRCRVAAKFLVTDVDLVTFDQPQQLLPGHVEGEADGVRDPQPLDPGGAGAGHGGRENFGPVVQLHVRQSAVRRDDALGPPGRPGGVDDVGGAIKIGLLPDRRGVLRRDAVKRFQDQQRAGVVNHGLAALGRKVKVQREVRRPGAQHGEERDDHVDAPGQCERDDLLGSRAALDQAAGHGVDARVEIGVGEALVAEDERGEAGGLLGLGGQHLRHGHIWNVCLVPTGLVAVFQRHRAGRDLQVVCQDAQDGDKVVNHLAGLVGRDDVGAVLQFDPQVGARRQDPGQRVVGGVGVLDVNDALGCFEVGEGAVGEEVLQHVQGVEELVVPGCALDVAEAQVLVRGQVETVLLGAAGEVGHCRAGSCRHPHRHGVEEQADDVLDAGDPGRASGHRGAEGDVAAAGAVTQDQAQGGGEHGVERDAGAPGLLGEPGRDRGGQRGEDTLGQQGFAAHRLGHHDRRLVEDRFPGGGGGVLVLRGDPRQIVGETGAFGGQRSGRTAGVVKREKLAQHQFARPAVPQQEMTREQQTVGAVGVAHHREAHERRIGQIERALAILGGNGLGIAVGNGDNGRNAGGDVLLRTRFADEGGAQGAVAVEQGGEGFSERFDIEAAVEVENVLGDVGVRAVGKGGLVVDALLQRGKVPDFGFCRFGYDGFLGVRGGYRGCCARTENILGGKLNALPRQQIGQPDRRDAVTAAGEEVIVDADGIGVQHLGKARHNLRFPFVARRRGNGRNGIRQGAPVTLSIGQQRYGLKHRNCRRNQITRQFLAQRRQQGLRIQRFAGLGYHISVQRTAIARDRYGLPHAQPPQQRRLDLGQLDPMPVDLYLVVVTTEELDLVACPTPEVTGAVQPLPRRERVSHEPRRGGPALPAIAARQLHAADVDLADRPGRNRLQRGVEQVDGHARNGPAQGDRLARRDSSGEDIPGVLRGTVRVHELGVRRRGGQRGHRTGIERLTAGDPPLQPAHLLSRGLGERRGQAGHGEQLGSAGLVHQPGQRRTISRRSLVRDHHCGPGNQATQEFGGAVDEAHGTLGDPDLAGPALFRPGQPVGQRAMGADDRLGPPGRAGRVHHGGRVERTDFDGPRFALGRADADDREIVRGQRTVGGVVDQDAYGLGVVEHELDAGGWIAGIDGEVGRAGAEDG